MRTLIRPFLVGLKRQTKIIFSEKNLLYTNTGLSIGISILGDAIQQVYQCSKRESQTPWRWDFPRTFQMAGAGLVAGPYAHYWYYYLDKFLPGRNLKTVFVKVCLDQFVCSPVWIFVFLITTGILQGQNWQQFKQEVKEKTLGLFTVEFLIWPPAQFINFFFLPTHYRVLYDNVISLLVEALYSYVRYDYGPESDGDKEKISDEKVTIANQNNVAVEKKVKFTPLSLSDNKVLLSLSGRNMKQDHEIVLSNHRLLIPPHNISLSSYHFVEDS